jgi:hypothetical protein
LQMPSFARPFRPGMIWNQSSETPGANAATGRIRQCHNRPMYYTM